MRFKTLILLFLFGSLCLPGRWKIPYYPSDQFSLILAHPVFPEQVYCPDVRQKIVRCDVVFYIYRYFTGRVRGGCEWTSVLRLRCPPDLRPKTCRSEIICSYINYEIIIKWFFILFLYYFTNIKILLEFLKYFFQ